MTILSIETSCDETAVGIVRAEGDFPNAEYDVLAHALFSQTDIHKEYGGVFPAVAKREHAKTLVPMLKKALDAAHLETAPLVLSEEKATEITKILEREPGLSDAFFSYLKETPEKPPIDLVAVTNGPGLEPTLWVGVNFAKALALAWDIPLVPVNHMEGHIFISLFDGKKLAAARFPVLSLLISGGHTELVLMKDWNEYELVGQTRDDAVGEAFDKVARMLGLPYPGGPQISKLAETARAEGVSSSIALPRPMIAANNCDFSFSGLKTAVLYALKKEYEKETVQTLTPEKQKEVALEFENAAAEVLVAKTKRALDEHDAQTLILGGGVSANTHIRRSFTELFSDEYPERKLYLPDPRLTTDNAVMIALAAHARAAEGGAGTDPSTIVANGNLSLTRDNKTS
jgi:N6-L-threonylcarbamoyladenine synthase